MKSKGFRICLCIGFALPFFAEDVLSSSEESSAPRFYAISIGNNCYPAHFLKACEFRTASFPLDWMLSNDFEGLQRAFKEDFFYFLDPEYLTFDEEKKSVNNTRYGFETDHFWDDDPVTKQRVNGNNFLDYCGSIREIFARRIQRLSTVLKSDIPIYLIRKKVVDYFQLISFRDFLLSKYQNIKLTIIVFDEIENPYPEVLGVRYYKVDNVDDFPGHSRSCFVGRSGWAELLQDLQQMWEESAKQDPSLEAISAIQ